MVTLTHAAVVYQVLKSKTLAMYTNYYIINNYVNISIIICGRPNLFNFQLIPITEFLYRMLYRVASIMRFAGRTESSV